MPAWGNTDNNHNLKPKFNVERETRENLQLTVLTGNNAPNTWITVSYNDGFQNNVANIGVAAGQYVYFWANGLNTNGGQAGNGVPGIFFSNTTVQSISGNTVVLASPLFGPVNAGWIMEFDKSVNYGTSKLAEKTYNQDTILVTQTRIANANSQMALGNIMPGWVHIQKKTNADGTVRYLKEVLVALANPTSSNTAGGNTSFGQVYSGV